MKKKHKNFTDDTLVSNIYHFDQTKNQKSKEDQFEDEFLEDEDIDIFQTKE
jgi:hypothetical protein